MASVSLGRSYHHTNFSTRLLRNTGSFRIFRTAGTTRSCQSRLPTDPSGSQTGKGNGREISKIFPRISLGAMNLGKNLKERLSPKQKGDWKDVVLMSLSFGVYVYISQKLVCAYCAWRSIFHQSW